MGALPYSVLKRTVEKVAKQEVIRDIYPIADAEFYTISCDGVCLEIDDFFCAIYPTDHTIGKWRLDMFNLNGEDTVENFEFNGPVSCAQHMCKLLSNVRNS